MSVTKAKVTVTIELIDEAEDGSQTVTERFAESTTFNFAITTGANGLNKEWNDRRTLAGSSETLDLTGGITNGRGEAITLADLKLFYLVNPADGATLTLGGGTNAFDTLFTSTIIVPPGSLILAVTSAANGWAIDAGTGDQLVVAGTTAKKYTLALGGE